MYEPGSHATLSAALMRVHPRLEEPRIWLAKRREDLERVTLAQTRPFDAAFVAFTEWLHQKRSMRMEDLSPMHQRSEEALEQLLSLGVSVQKGLGSKPLKVVELFYRQGRCRARVKQVDPN